jgi:hypothetical protein
MPGGFQVIKVSPIYAEQIAANLPNEAAAELWLTRYGERQRVVIYREGDGDFTSR